jgi:predicted DCC family thiol-disulfide oxidoreductase YuxK
MNPVIIFDGHCRLCHWSVQFLLRHDHKRLFRFATLDSNFVKGLATAHIAIQGDSVLLWHNNKLYERSTAVIQMLRLLGGFWRLHATWLIIPPFLRNWAYDLVARNRYRMFGKFDNCPLPSSENQARFLA